jgi:RNA polymerase sigma-70 factor, ECF subfamily
LKAYGGIRLLPTAANRQPAFAAYSRADAAWVAHSLHVLTLEQDMISRLTLFYVKPTGPRLFQAFALPPTLPDGATAKLLSTLRESLGP